MTFEPVENYRQLKNMIEMNSIILSDQIKLQILNRLGTEQTLKEGMKVLTPLLYENHFMLLAYEINFNKLADIEISFDIKSLKLIDSISSTDSFIVKNIEALFKKLNNELPVECDLKNTGHQKDGYTCGPRVVKTIIDHLKASKLCKKDFSASLQNVLKLTSGENPYIEIVNLIELIYTNNHKKNLCLKLIN